MAKNKTGASSSGEGSTPVVFRVVYSKHSAVHEYGIQPGALVLITQDFRTISIEAEGTYWGTRYGARIEQLQPYFLGALNESDVFTAVTAPGVISCRIFNFSMAAPMTGSWTAEEF